jgi:hypothetical protein
MLDAATDPDLLADSCAFRHRLFSTMGEVMFRRSATDNVPAMAMQFGEREALVPLYSLQREFSIADDSDDGRMLAKVAQALDFVSMVRIGDRLPPEVLTGDASWEPDPIYLQIAAARLRMQLVNWLNDSTGGSRIELTAENLSQVADDPAIRQKVQAAIVRAAETLGLDGPERIVEMIAELAAELAYIEALRDRLLRRVRALSARVERPDCGARGDTLAQVGRLTAIALRQLTERFDELDAQTSDVMTALREADCQRTFIRSNRDWLYRSQRGWDPLLSEWDTIGQASDERMAGLLRRTYQFLAPRFMPVTEWLTANRPRRVGPKQPTRMVW